MAGGVGSRFWPFSRNERPKQFLDFFGTGKSLLQMTVDRFRPLVPTEQILIVTNVQYKNIVLEQIPDLQETQVLCEPARRNTAPCIAYATARINALSDEANIIVAPSDHLVLHEDVFRQTIEKGLQFVATHDALLTLGMQPTRPETGYGYIQKSEGDGTLCRVKTFTEKPNRELAEMFIKSGEFLWNSGMFLWNLQSINKAFATHLPDIAEKFSKGASQMGTTAEDAFIQEIFPSCANISIDYGLMEKADNVYVLAADFGWSDLGTWDSLYDLSEKDGKGNVSLKCETAFYDSNGNIVVLPEGKLAVIQGIDDCIVAESDNVLLICKKENEQNIRQFVNDAQVRFDGKYN